MIRRHFFLVAAVAILILMVVIGALKLLGGKPEGEGAGPGGGARGRPASPVSVVTVGSRAFSDDLELLGVAKGRQSVTLTAATTQLVERVRFTDGQTVAKGAVLVELRSTEQGAELAQARARAVEAKRAYDRYNTLGMQGYVSKAAIDQYEATYLAAKADVDSALARQSDRTIRAPFAGVVGLSDVAPGALVNPGAPIVTLDDLSALRVDFQVPERYLAQIREGQTISAKVDALPGYSITGRIARIDTRVDERTRAITARAEFANPGARLKPGMMIRVSLARGQRQSLAAPESAVAVEGDSAFIYVLKTQNGQTITEQRPVVTGVRQGGFVEISDGAQPGEKIVADGLNKIQPGQPVRVGGNPPAGQQPKPRS